MRWHGGLAAEISDATKIDIRILSSTTRWRTASVAQRMSWASGRRATKGEDTAYGLLGLFEVNMPLLYGEKAKDAFLRLQRQISARFDDESILVWKWEPSARSGEGELLASSPDAFASSGSVLQSSIYADRSLHLRNDKILEIESPYRTAIVDNLARALPRSETRTNLDLTQHIGSALEDLAALIVGHFGRTLDSYTSNGAGRRAYTHAFEDLL